VGPPNCTSIARFFFLLYSSLSALFLSDAIIQQARLMLALSCWWMSWVCRVFSICMLVHELGLCSVSILPVQSNVLTPRKSVTPETCFYRVHLSVQSIQVSECHEHYTVFIAWIANVSHCVLDSKGTANLFCKGADNKYIGLCRSRTVCHIFFWSPNNPLNM
jgi:hypothetical protein